METAALAGLARALGARDGARNAVVGAVRLVVERDPVTGRPCGRVTGGGTTRLIGTVLTPGLVAGLAPAVAVGVPDGRERSFRILLAEDDAVSREIAQLILERAGHTVSTVTDGRSAVRAALTGDHDLVLMDLSMPELDGFEATRQIRATEPPGRRTPIVAVTANTQASDRDACRAAGMDGFLSKPITWEAVRAALSLAAPTDPPSRDRPPDRDLALDGDRIAAAFVRDGLRHVGEAMAAAESGDLDRARRALHALKGLAATFGCVDVARDAQALFEVPSSVPELAPDLRSRIEDAGATLAGGAILSA